VSETRGDVRQVRRDETTAGQVEVQEMSRKKEERR
jgi:hypothetical protein